MSLAMLLNSQSLKIVRTRAHRMRKRNQMIKAINKKSKKMNKMAKRR